MTAEAAITVGFAGLGNMGMTKAISAGQSSSITSELSDSSRKCRHECRANATDAGREFPASI